VRARVCVEGVNRPETKKKNVRNHGKLAGN